MKMSKIIWSGLGILAAVAATGFLYVSHIANGSQPDWDPESYVTVKANDLEFSVDVRGDKANTPVILLHGFPEAAVMWDPFMEELVEKNYYAIAPNQRGYSSGARPENVEAYQIDHLASDIIAIADELGLEKFHLIGHDWGAVVGWKLAADHPDRIISYSAISVPHIDSFTKAYREDPEQYEASGYIRFFQKSTLPEFALANNDYEKLQSIWSSHDEAEIDHYLNIFSQKGALTAAINWYRANFSAFEGDIVVGKANVPVTFIWGNGDKAIKRSGVDETRDLVDSDYQFIEMDASHWIIQEEYDALSDHLIGHMEKYNVAEAP